MRVTISRSRAPKEGRRRRQSPPPHQVRKQSSCLPLFGRFFPFRACLLLGGGAAASSAADLLLLVLLWLLLLLSLLLQWLLSHTACVAKGIRIDKNHGRIPGTFGGEILRNFVCSSFSLPHVRNGFRLLVPLFPWVCYDGMWCKIAKLHVVWCIRFLCFIEPRALLRRKIRAS